MKYAIQLLRSIAPLLPKELFQVYNVLYEGLSYGFVLLDQNVCLIISANFILYSVLIDYCIVFSWSFTSQPAWSWHIFFLYFHFKVLHYIDVIMTTVASQITSLTIVYSIVYSGEYKRKHQSSASLAFVRGIHRDRWFPRTRASYAENVSIWWRHHDYMSDSYRGVTRAKTWFLTLTNVMMPSYQFRKPRNWDKTIWWPYDICFILNQRPGWLQFSQQ